MRLYHESAGIQIWHADCLDVLPTYPDGCVDLVLIRLTVWPTKVIGAK